MHFSDILLIALSLFVVSVKCETLDNVAYSRFGACRTHKPSDDDRIKTHAQLAVPIMGTEKSKGYLGTVGIVGGSVEQTGAAYFAAMTALRVGADVVHIFCTRLAGPPLQAMSPDIIVHPLHDVNVEILIAKLNTVDVVVLGPGLDREPHSAATIIPRVVLACKTLKKPLVVDLDPYFLTQAVLNQFLKYPAPGLVMIMNSDEFEIIYKMIKSAGSYSDAHLSLDYDKLGENFMVYRKGCTDVAVSQNSASSWSLAEGGSPRRSAGQGHMIAGATGIYYYWAMNTLPANLTVANGPMFPAAMATYYAAKMMRAANRMAFAERGRSAITTDMLDKVQEVLYGGSNLMEDNN